MSAWKAPALTRKQRQIYGWICAQTKAGSRPPTVMEVAAHFKMVCGNAVVQIQALRAAGYLERFSDPRSPRYGPARPCPHCGHPVTTEKRRAERKPSAERDA